MSILDVKKLLVIVAHYDDETMFCGGTLIRLRNLGCDISIAVVTDVKDTNFGSNDEELRMKMRLESFDEVVSVLQARSFHLKTSNYRGQPNTFFPVYVSASDRIKFLIDDTNPEVILTHDHNGEYGNWMHRLVHYAVRDVWNGRWFTFNFYGENVSIALDEKKKLSDVYLHSVVIGQEWRPYNQSVFVPWFTDIEGFREESV